MLIISTCLSRLFFSQNLDVAKKNVLRLDFLNYYISAQALTLGVVL